MLHWITTTINLFSTCETSYIKVRYAKGWWNNRLQWTFNTGRPKSGHFWILEYFGSGFQMEKGKYLSECYWNTQQKKRTKNPLRLQKGACSIPFLTVVTIVLLLFPTLYGKRGIFTRSPMLVAILYLFSSVDLYISLWYTINLLNNRLFTVLNWMTN